MKSSICTAVLLLISSYTFALDITDSEDPVQYAAETLDTTSTTPGVNANSGLTFFNIADTASGSLDLVGDLSASEDEFFTGSNFYFRFDLEGAAWSSTLTAPDLVITTVGAADVISQGGTAGESFVIFDVIPLANNNADDTFSLSVPGIAVLDDSEILVSFSTHRTVTDALGSSNAISGGSASYVDLVNGISIQSDPRDQQIDVDRNQEFYVVQAMSTNASGTVATLGKIVVESVNAVQVEQIYDQSGTVHTLADSVVDADVLITGDFTNGTYYLDTSVICPSSDTPPDDAANGALTLAEDKQSATQTLAVLSTNEWLCHIVEEDMTISESTYEVTLDFEKTPGSQEVADGVSAFGTVTANKDLSADRDGDGVPDVEDAFPDNPAESADTDGDEIGNNEDSDDDDDGLPDTFEESNGLDALNFADADEDKDGDGVSNLVEFQQGTDVNDPNDVGDVCLLGTPPGASESALAFETILPFVNPASNTNQQTFLRLVNPDTTATAVEIYATDDSGQASRRGPLELMIAPGSALQLTAQDLENGNELKGVTNKLCDGSGKWNLVIRSASDIDVMGLIRTPDGFLTEMSSVVPRTGNHHYAYFVNPASNVSQQSFLRLTNLSSVEANVSINGTDDAGTPGDSSLSLSMQPDESVQLTAEDLENGSPSKNLSGALGDGAGKWRLEIFSSFELAVMSLIRSSDGFLTNLSAIVPEDFSDNHSLYFVNPATESEQQSFIRVINISDQDGTVTISGNDDAGNGAPNGNVSFELLAGASKQMTIQDLEAGNLDKDLLGSLGDGAGRWRLVVTADVELQVMNLIRTQDGFLTNLGEVAPVTEMVNTVTFFNPASNQDQVSSLRIVNDSNQSAAISIVGIDDDGESFSDVAFNLAAGNSQILTAGDLENGNAAKGLVGSLGDGVGKWRLTVNSDVEVQVQSLLETPNGFITNLSSPVAN